MEFNSVGAKPWDGEGEGWGGGLTNVEALQSAGVHQVSCSG